MQSAKGFAGLGAHTSPAPHAGGAPVGAQTAACVVQVAGGTLGVCCDAAQLPPLGCDETLT
jgi:hypothetical protein